MLSAMLDGEDAPGERTRAERHLTECDDCRRWWDAATTITRLARTQLTGVTPDVPDSVLDAAPGPTRARVARVLRGCLAGVGAIQLGVGLVQVSGFGQNTLLHDGHAISVSATYHLWHESAAWNIAIGAAFLWTAWRSSRPTGVLPILTAFVATLTLLSASDLVAGQVETGRLVSHALILTGYGVILALSSRTLDFGEPPAEPSRRAPSWSLHRRAATPSA
jgi:predicted anti-sigma-YlaC factor YlaD